MKKTGILKAMKLCMDYKKMTEAQRLEIQKKRLADIVSHARKNSPYYRELYRNLPESFTLAELPATDKKTLMENWDSWYPAWHSSPAGCLPDPAATGAPPWHRPAAAPSWTWASISLI